MIDVEKVIKGLECCDDTSMNTLNCEECPYRETDTCSAVAKLHQDACALLKEQNVAKPAKPEREWSDDLDNCAWWYICGNCEGMIDYKDKYCRHCGREVKWT